MKITVLAENTSKKENIGCEHGLSLLIETEKHIILFDMGQSELFAENAEKLGIDLGNVDIAVLSHGHYDHGGGLKKFLELNSKAPVFINRYAFEPHFNAEKKYIGLDTELQYSERLVFTDEEYLIDKGLTLFSCYELSKRSDAPSAGLYEMKNGVYIDGRLQIYTEPETREETARRIHAVLPEIQGECDKMPPDRSPYELAVCLEERKDELWPAKDQGADNNR